MICLSNRYNQQCRGFDGREGRRRSATGIAVNSPALSQYETAQGLVGVSTEAGASIGVTSNPRLCPLRSRSHPSYNTPPCEAPMPFTIRPSRRFPVLFPGVATALRSYWAGRIDSACLSAFTFASTRSPWPMFPVIWVISSICNRTSLPSYRLTK